ncbi:WD40 repeat domain-containing protein [Streptomyces sp. NPDC056323]|uniref:WD40 repeat domain-containing protein n=1 Tax=Streptomyces sp. NPDC056323 TaxID=3345784 RepID=UPI0035D7DE1A
MARARLIALDETTADLAHEALITSWPRLRSWIGADRERMRQHRLLTDAATSWHALGRDPGALYRGARLTAAEGHFARRPGEEDELNSLEREFLTAGLAARTRDRRLRRTRALCVLLVLALMAGLTVWQQNRADERRRIEAEARRIAGIAESMRRSDPLTAMRLGLASWRIARLPETRAAYYVLSAELRQATYMVYALDGRFLLLAQPLGQDSSAARWDVRDRRGTMAWAGNSKALLRAPDGRWLITSDGWVHKVYKTAGWELPAASPILTEALPLAATADGTYQAVGDPSGRIALWSTRRSNGEHDGELIGSGPGASDPILALAFSPDSRRLAASSADGALRILDIASRRPIGTPLLTSGDRVTNLRFSPNGNELYTSGRNIPFQAYGIGADAAAATVCRRADGPCLAVTGSSSSQPWRSRTSVDEP